MVDPNLKEHIRKAVEICGVAPGPFGAARVIENPLPVLRELGLTTTFTDLNFANAAILFSAADRLLDDAFVRWVGEFFDELIWTARGLCAGSPLSRA